MIWPDWSRGIAGKLLAGGLIILGILGAALRLFSAGEKTQKAKTIDAQRKVERETMEAAQDAKRKAKQELDQSRANADRGDFSDFNAD